RGGYGFGGVWESYRWKVASGKWQVTCYLPLSTCMVLLDAPSPGRYTRPRPGRSLVRLERAVWDREVGGSNPLAPTHTNRCGACKGDRPVALTCAAPACAGPDR